MATVLARPAYAQERVRVKATAGEPATTSVPSEDESIPLYTVRARILRSGGLPVSWVMRKLLELGSAKGGAAFGAAIGSLAGPGGALVGGLVGRPGGALVGGLVGGRVANFMAQLLGILATADLRCGVDLDIVAPASVEDNPYGRWRLDIPFEFDLVSPRMPTATDWDSTTYVDAGSTITATAHDSLCRGAAITVEYEYEYDCDLYCDTTDPDAVCPARCRAFEMEFVPIPAGRFLMGSRELTYDERQKVPEEDRPWPNEYPQHRRSVGQFSLGKYEVTQAQWVAVMGEQPRCFIEECDTCPVTCVSWFAAQEFIETLNELQSESRYRYRLPTEAEWEYAARAGTTGVRYGALDSIAWYHENSGGRRHPVGQKRANAWGLHDMLGNVWEWTADWARSYPGAEDEFDSTGSSRVNRGGSWIFNARYVRSAYRVINVPGYRNSSPSASAWSGQSNPWHSYPLTLFREAETGVRPLAKAGAQATEPSGVSHAGAAGEARGPGIFSAGVASVLARVLTLRFDQRLEAFDDQPLREFLAHREVLAVREHFFQCNHVPYMAVMVTYALEPSTPHSPPRDAAQGRRGTDRGVQVAEADIPLYDALRDWRAERARRDGVPPYIVCTNLQLAEMIKARPQSMSKLGTIDGIGKAKLEKYGQDLLALLAWPKGATERPAEPVGDSGSAQPAKAPTPDQADPGAEGGQRDG